MVHLVCELAVHDIGIRTAHYLLAYNANYITYALRLKVTKPTAESLGVGFSVAVYDLANLNKYIYNLTNSNRYGYLIRMYTNTHCVLVYFCYLVR